MERSQQPHACTSLRNGNPTFVLIRCRASLLRRSLGNCRLPFRKLIPTLFFDGLVATRTRFAYYVMLRFEILRHERAFARKAFARVGRFQQWVHRYALIKDEAVTLVMRMLALFEIL